MYNIGSWLNYLKHQSFSEKKLKWMNPQNIFKKYLDFFLNSYIFVKNISQLHKTHPYKRFHELFSTNYPVENRNIYYFFLNWQVWIQLQLQKYFGFIVVIECIPKRREKLFPVIEFLFYRNIYALFLKKMGRLWECLEMIFRIFPVYTQKTVPQRYLFFSRYV